ncbi:hypothetical protein BJD12_23270 (plasmid) [Xanthomonas vesicatoria ATCC 35937]|nr:hypothetical protein BJD13_00620 [Xanthomonas perforans]APP78248.1 hypothetical protein BJD12_23270 [Xanthomonas vesicatoria ATCC 35937]APP87261.1 hypothetical protein BI317_24680 [Xanthomonas hortorum pv. gardneri]KHM93307.1 hypothetical protein OR60_14125 [Xanthomonas vesicatoria]KLB02541.1 hypothetical protein SM19410_00825 [Xanthomonas hortorum pv. gardneri]
MSSFYDYLDTASIASMPAPPGPHVVVPLPQECCALANVLTQLLRRVVDESHTSRSAPPADATDVSLA